MMSSINVLIKLTYRNIGVWVKRTTKGNHSSIPYKPPVSKIGTPKLPKP